MSAPAKPSPVCVFLCEESGVMAHSWAAAGFQCFCFDLAHSIRRDRVEQVGEGVITYRWADVRSLTRADFPGTVAFLAAFPPCTDLAVSGARDFGRKGLRRLIDALETVEACRQLAENTGAPWMLENPVGRLSTLWRQPDHTFDPCDFAGYPGGDSDTYTKRTCLWTGGGFIMPAPRRVDPVQGSRMHLLPPSAERARIRSRTPVGFAHAVFEANRTGPLDLFAGRAA